MKYTAIILLSAVLAACTPSASNQTDSGKWYLPQGLKDCEIYRMGSSMGDYITVMRCPASDTCVTTHGKHPKESCVIEGEL